MYQLPAVTYCLGLHRPDRIDKVSLKGQNVHRKPGETIIATGDEVLAVEAT